MGKPCTVFSELVLKWGFHQIELEEQSRNITTFITHKWLFRYKRQMFGISSEPQLYQHTIQQALEGCESAYNIHDDIIIHGRSVEKHDARLRKTSVRIQANGLTLNRDKCAFSMSKLTLMGCLLSNQRDRANRVACRSSDWRKRASKCKGGTTFSGVSELWCQIHLQFSKHCRTTSQANKEENSLCVGRRATKCF